MKKIFITILIGSLILQCKNVDESQQPDPTKKVYFETFNTDETYENKHSLSIETDEYLLSFNSTKDENSLVHNGFLYSENGLEVSFQNIETKDTAYIFELSNGQLDLEGFKIYAANNELILEYIRFNPVNSSYHILFSQNLGPFKNTTSLKINDFQEEFEERIDEFGEMVDDAIDTFRSGTLFGNLFKKLESIKDLPDEISEKGKELLNNVKTAGNKMKEYVSDKKSDFKEYVKEKMDEATKDNLDEMITTKEEFYETDCYGDKNGMAVYDMCMTCVKGNTGKIPCEKDCYGEYGGEAFIDDCNRCVGGNSGKVPCGEDFIYDIDDNFYGIITIGNQKWLDKDLNTSRLNDGTDIPFYTQDWGTSGGMEYNTYDDGTSWEYGAYYNWEVVNSSKLCPHGWHVPSKQEWQTLIDNTGGNDDAGFYLKSGPWHFTVGGINTYNFNALPGGLMFDGPYSGHSNRGAGAYWWTSTEQSGEQAVKILIEPDPVIPETRDGIYESTGDKTLGLNVRCIKD